MHLRLSTDSCFTDFELTVRHSGCMMFSERRHTGMNTGRILMKKQNSDKAALKKYTMILPLLDENLQNVHTIVKITNRKTTMNYLRMPVL